MTFFVKADYKSKMFFNYNFSSKWFEQLSVKCEPEGNYKKLKNNTET